MNKIIALRLMDKSVRLRVSLNLPELMKYGLNEIAKHENKSLSWVIEQDLLKLYGFPVEYNVPKKKRK